jgi:hypothetical protein
LVNFCWFLFKWGMVPGVIAAVVVVAYLDHRLNEEIRCRVQARIARHYRHLQVTVRSAELVKGEGIEVRGLSIRVPGVEGPRAELVHLEAVFLKCPTDLKDLLSDTLRVTHVTLRRPTFRVSCRRDGTWSTAALLPLPRLSEHPPEVTIDGGTIEVVDAAHGPSGTLTLRDVNLVLSPPENAGATAPGRRLRGTLSGDYLHRVRFEGTVDPDSEQWTVGGMVEGLEISPELRDALPSTLASKLSELAGFRATGEFSFRLRSDPSPDRPYRFELAGRVARGRLDDPRLPYPLTDIRAAVRANNEGFAVDELFAQSGQSTLRLSCRRAGYEPGSPWSLEAEIRQLELDRQLRDSLPEELQNHWRKYLPTGQVHANVKLVSDGHRWRLDQSEVSIRCLDVSFTYHKFPYRLEHGTGTLDLAGDILRVNMIAHSGGRPIRLAAEVHHPTGPSCGWFSARGENLPLDDKLLDALDDRSRNVVRSLNPQGTIDFSVRTWRDKPGGPPRRHVLVALCGCRIRFDKFPYPLANVRGTLEQHPDGSWAFRDLKGTNDTGRVTCEGWLARTPEGKRLSLRLTGRDIPLEEELRDALRPNMQQVWNDLKPRGMVDLPEIGIEYLVDRKQFSLTVVGRPQHDSTSVEPRAFPYRMELTRGTMVYRDGRVTLEGLKARHGPVRLSGAGYCDFLPDGSWHFHLGGISVDRLRLDRELIQALPGPLRKGLAALSPTGAMDLHDASLDLKRSGRPGDPLQAQWAATVGFHQASVDCGVRLTNAYGDLTIQGGLDAHRFHCRGELNVDSLTYKDIQFTQVRGPFWIDNEQVLLGSWVNHPSRLNTAEGGRATLNTAEGGRATSGRPGGRATSRKLTATLFGGTVEGDCWMALGDDPRFALHATLAGADLHRWAKETISGRNCLRGKIAGVVDLRGRGRSLNALAGRGQIRLREADIYELPLMIALLKILSIREPDQTAFSKSAIDFRIKGNHIYFDRIDFNGDAISLLGKGDMDFQSNIDLAFHAVVGRDEFRVPVISGLLGGASQQIMLIKVRGTVEHPKTSRDVLPGVKQALQQLQADLPRMNPTEPNRR